MILGGLVVVALFAALIGPYFINWNDYKGTFEAEAEKILGQPVRVVGTASATLLPLPSLTFTQVEVGDTEGAPMMTVEHFDVTIELMPLLEGEIRVVSMKLQKPHIKVSVDDSGTVDWLLRSEASKALNPDKVVLEDVEIVDGSVDYIDGSSGIQLGFDHINSNLQATSLTGPWKISGTYQQQGSPFQFDISTGKWAQDQIRVKTTLDPANLPFTLSADGAIGNGKGGLSYSGTYGLTQVVPAGPDGKPGGDGWHSEGAFNLSRDRLVIPKAVVSQGPPDRPASLAGSLVLSLGSKAKFTASVTARQLDLDRTLGKGPTAPVKVSEAVQSFVSWLSGVPAPSIPGNISFSVPAIVVGGAIVQDVSFDASPEPGGWQVDGFHAQLPGQATLDAAGTLTTGDPGRVGFGGQVHLAVNQPVGFASWWRGTRDLGAGRLLAPFDLAGRARVEMGRVAVDSMQIKIGDERIAGSFAWSGGADGGKRLLETDLKASRLDFSQIKALTELIIGKDLADTGVLADSYAVSIAADELSVGDVTMRDVTADAGFVDGTLKVNGILIGDIGGARVSVTRGEVEDIFGSPKGQLEAHLNAPDVTGLARFLDRLMPNTPLTLWLNAAAPALSPAALDAKIEAPTKDGSATVRIGLHGSASASTFDAGLDLKGAPSAWQTGEVTLTASLASYDGMNLARQTGLDPAEIEQAGSAKLDLSAKGVPATGLATKVTGMFAGTEFGTDGTLVLADTSAPAFKGQFDLKSGDVMPFLTMARLKIPGLAGATSIGLDGTLNTTGPSGEIAWTNGSIAGRQLGGTLKLIAGEGQPRLDGEVSIDNVDFGWLTSLAVGYPMLPGTGGDKAWSDAAFGDPTFAGLAGTIAFDAGRLTLIGGYDIAKAKLSLGLNQDRADLNLLAGEIAGGTVTGGLTIHNVGGNANLTGRLSLNGTNLESVVWQRGGRPVATGTMDLAATFEATGRSLAGLVSSLTGSGNLAIHNGEARYINPQAASLVIRATDVGQQLSDQALADQFATYMDGGSLAFGEASGDFSIAAGTARLKSLAIEAAKTKSVGSAAVDLGALSISSDWTMTFDPGDAKIEGAVPQAGILFRGPLAAPTRSFDLLPLSSYINIRQEARLQEILSTQEAVRLEKERFTRERRKLKEDADRAAREAAAAAELRATMLAALASFHETREVFAEKRAAEQLANARAAAAAVAKALAEKAAVEAADAEAAASQAEARLESAKQASVDAIQAVAEQQAAEESAAAAVVRASADAATAAGAVDAARQATGAAKAALAEAERVAAEKAKALADASAAAEKARAEVAAAESAAKASGGSAADAAAAVKAAKKEAEAKAALVASAMKEAEKTAKHAEEAAALAGEAATKKADAEKSLGEATEAEKQASAAADAALAARDQAAKAASDAAAKVTAVNAALSEAQKVVDAAKAERDAAVQAADVAAQKAADASAALKALREEVAAREADAAAAAKALAEAKDRAAQRADDAKAAASKIDGLKGEAAAAAKTAADQVTAANAAKLEADQAEAKAAEAEKVAADAVAKAKVAREQADAAKKDADGAASAVAEAEKLAAELKADMEAKQAELAKVATTDTEALSKAQSASLQASDSYGKASEALAKLQADLKAAEAKAKAAEDAAKAADAGVAGPQAAASDAAKLALDAKGKYAEAQSGADTAQAASKDKQKALTEVEAALAAAQKAADEAAAAVTAAEAKASAAEDSVREAAGRVPALEEAEKKALADKVAADRLRADKETASAAAAEKFGAVKAERDAAAAVQVDADASVKVAEKKVADSAAAKEAASAEVGRASGAVTAASAAYDQAVSALAAAKGASEKAAADLKAAEEDLKSANAAVTAAESAASGAGSSEAAAKKRVIDARAAAGRAATLVEAATAARDEADAAAKTAGEAADSAVADEQAAVQAASDAAAAAAAARQQAEQAKADRAAAERAVADADEAVSQAEAAVASARDVAAEKAKVAESTRQTAAAAAEAAGQTLVMKIAKPAIDAPPADAPVPAAGDDGDTSAGAPVREPPMPPPRPTLTPKPPAKRAPAPMPLNIVPQAAQ